MMKKLYRLAKLASYAAGFALGNMVLVYMTGEGMWANSSILINSLALAWIMEDE